MDKTKSVESYIAKSGKWQEALNLLREIMLSTELTETVKWGAPVYTLGNKHIVGLGAFKSYAGLWFFQGALLTDEHKKLINAQEGVTKAQRQWRFESSEEIKRQAPVIRAYIAEAIANQKAGREIKPAKKKPLVIPEELRVLMDTDPGIKKSFESLTLTKKRDFAEYIAEAKRAETRQKRLEKIKPMILEGVGLNDKYTR